MTPGQGGACSKGTWSPAREGHSSGHDPGCWRDQPVSLWGLAFPYGVRQPPRAPKSNRLGRSLKACCAHGRTAGWSGRRACQLSGTPEQGIKQELGQRLLCFSAGLSWAALPAPRHSHVSLDKRLPVLRALLKDRDLSQGLRPPRAARCTEHVCDVLQLRPVAPGDRWHTCLPHK